MLTIQDVGNEVLGGTPRKFYVFAGSEYGIKQKYIELIAQSYNSEVVDAPNVNELLQFMSTRHLIPLTPKVYVVRYDEDFLSKLDEKTSSNIDKCKIVGTIICLYDSAKAAQKLDKYLPNFTVSIDTVSDKFLISYLHKDFPSLPDRLINLAVTMCSDYNNASNICRCMKCVPVERLYVMSDEDIFKTFGHTDSFNDDDLKKAIASRNFKVCLNMFDKYSGTTDEFFYSVLSTMIELEKISYNKHVESSLRTYQNRWTLKDIYNLFMNTYSELKKLRTYSQSPYESALYIIGLLQFSEIPGLEEMNEF